MIRGGAAVAALRRIQLDQRGRVRPAVGRARRFGGARGESDRDCDRGKKSFRFHSASVGGKGSFLTGAHGTRVRKSGKLGSSPLWSPTVNPIYKWMGIVLAVGIALMVIEYRFAKKKKEGVTPTDKKRIVGIFWIAISMSLLVGALMLMSGD